MRSRRERARVAPLARVALAALAALAACGSDIDPACRSSTLDYQTFGAPFVTSWCRGCHSVDAPAGMRQLAPLGMNFDTVDDVRAWSAQIVVSTVDLRTMPPAGGPSDGERALLADWLACGAK